MMRRLLKRIAVLLLAGCIYMGISGEVRIVSAAVIEDVGGLGDPDYKEGPKGGIQVQSGFHSLKKGDIIEVDILYNRDKFENPMCGFTVLTSYDKAVLEYAGADIRDEHRIEYGAVEDLEEIEDLGEIENWGSELFTLIVNYKRKSFDKNSCVATIKYRVKKDTPSVLIYFNEISLVVPEEDYTTYEYGFNMKLTDTSDTVSTFTLSTVPAQGSEEITVPINIEKNDGFNLLGLTLNYDDSLFTYESLEIDDSLKSKIGQESIYPVSDSGKVKASFIALEDITDVGNFLTLKLKVKDGVPAGTTSNVRVEITQVGNKAETSMSGTGTTCAISITDKSGGEEQQPILGDVNADKKIDLVDAVYILQNYNQVREFTKVQETAADVTRDGTVNLVDALMIMKYFNEEITEF